MLNGAVNLLLLLGVCRWENKPAAPLRLLLAALVGGGYAWMSIMADFSFMSRGVWQLLFLGITSLIAFGMHVSTLRLGVEFSLLWFALHALAAGFQQGDIWTGVLWASLLLLLYLVRTDDRAGRNFVNLCITHRSRTVRLTALRDTGNQLTDPLTGKSVLIVGPDVAQRLLGLSRQQLLDPIQTMQLHPIPGLRLVPYRSVGQPVGLLLAMHFPDVTLNRQRGGQVVAFSPDAIGSGKGFEALAGGMA